MKLKRRTKYANAAKIFLFAGIALLVTFCAKEQFDKPIAGPPVPSQRILFADSTCSFPGDSIQPMHFNIGDTAINSILVDGLLRKYIVYVPSGYDSTSSPYPLVLMLHGSSQTAHRMVIATTWRNQADIDGLIIVYPQSESYLIGGVPVNKWASVGMATLIDPGQSLADDVKFIKEVNKTVASNLHINCRRVYACGFSNGGGFIKSRLRVKADNMLAATASYGGLGLPVSNVPDHFKYRPHYEVVGNKDGNKIANCQAVGETFSILPRRVDTIKATPCMWDPLTTMRTSLELDTTHTFTETMTYTEIIFANSLVGQNTEYRFRLLRGLEHEIPGPFNGYSPDYVPIFWDWLQGYSN